MNHWKIPETYRVIRQTEVKELNADAWILEHIKTGARVFLLSNEDENKVFNIGFRTPPKDSTGVPHIMEHSVLCGSKKFPVKDPFVELVKGSLNTFLNAMTYPDKTVYPVASTNEKDFQNLMDVYLDAVFHPNIYQQEKIFRQEGWHYEMEEEDGPITYNGVVYNEMKGAFSSPDGILDRYTQAYLFPDNCYGVESGGDPKHIPDLTYEAFLDFHRTFYHPSNSYIYLYGDMNMTDKLEWIDAEYLSHYDKIVVDSEIPMQKPFSEPKEAVIPYSITEEEDDTEAAYLSITNVVGTDLDPKLYVAFQILEYTLLDAPGAPLKQALLDAEIGQEIYGGYESGILQPYFSVVAKNARLDQKEKFRTVIKETLTRLSKEGINRKSILAAMNVFEFKYRESDYGSYPKGLMYGLQCMDSWLYDGDPLMHLQYQETFDYLKKVVDTGYFESLITTYLLENPYELMLILKPEKNLTAKEEALVARELEEYKQTLSKEQIKKLIQQTEELKEYQDEPSPEEDLEKIPLLAREDIGKKAEKINYIEKEIHGVKVFHHNLFTSGIGYLRILFDLNRLKPEEMPYAAMLKSILGYIDTENYTYSDLTSEINLNSGGVSVYLSSYVDLKNLPNFKAMMIFEARVLYEKLDFACNILAEIIHSSKLSDTKRLAEILKETRSRLHSKLESSGHTAAVVRASSYFSPTAAWGDATSGVAYYQFLDKVIKELETTPETLVAKLQEVAGKLFTVDNVLVSYTADENGFTSLESCMESLIRVLPQGTGETYLYPIPSELKNEGLKTSSQVNYVARCGNFRKAGFDYTGALRILKVIMGYEYLWINVRVKGGAYGCSASFGRSGEGYLVSYRDPNVRETNQIYEDVVEYLRNFNVSDRDMTKFVIGTISSMDTPLNPSDIGARAMSGYLSGVTDEMLQQERDEVLAAGVEDIRKLSDLVQAVLQTGAICTIGNEDKIEQAKDLFLETRNLFGSEKAEI